ncbi:hypothetical protein PAHAL_2G029000 [Panicum hallii]|uniref:Uncharacterized protein n=1 Tax=Panicum hallii TaxID=206008 RepID=A0A2T8KML8_9POAL|nr:hypothetical protein PAHAL_2G029000 [Panicum hallii]
MAKSHMPRPCFILCSYTLGLAFSTHYLTHYLTCLPYCPRPKLHLPMLCMPTLI